MKAATPTTPRDPLLAGGDPARPPASTPELQQDQADPPAAFDAELSEEDRLEAIFEARLSEQVLGACEQIRRGAAPGALLRDLGLGVQDLRDDYERQRALCEARADAQRRIANGEPPGPIHELLALQERCLQRGGGVQFPIFRGPDLALGLVRKLGPYRPARQAHQGRGGRE